MAKRKYDQQLKKDVIDAALIGNKSAAQMAREHNIPDSSVYSWIRSYKEKHDIARFELGNETPKQEIARLKAEISKATQERDILKKSHSVFCQPREVSVQPTQSLPLPNQICHFKI